MFAPHAAWQYSITAVTVIVLFLRRAGGQDGLFAECGFCESALVSGRMVVYVERQFTVREEERTFAIAFTR
ncbi:hypothetical protein N2599_09545 [Rhizobium sullae]|uniref:Secreted protein n=1 Tax=Rhizobium sullae TaxID=50338 RepID=A0ABY5XR27_RHISU|nr:hypothetical protein [Rhizobium sullae]UWU16566.1 hypothetical protein N2599_09545 [Rhizobium sullae]